MERDIDMEILCSLRPAPGVSAAKLRSDLGINTPTIKLAIRRLLKLGVEVQMRRDEDFDEVRIKVLRGSWARTQEIAERYWDAVYGGNE